VRFAHLPPSCAVSLAPSFSPLLVPPCPPPFPYTTLFRSVDEPFAFVVLHPVDHAPHLHVHVGVVGVGRRHRDPVVPLQVLELLRSEEHTSELQSRFDLVCRLLLEKKKSDSQPNLNARPAR